MLMMKQHRSRQPNPESDMHSKWYMDNPLRRTGNTEINRRWCQKKKKKEAFQEADLRSLKYTLRFEETV
jgi:hypothetical protein